MRNRVSRNGSTVNVAAMFDRQARATPAATALDGMGGVVRYGELRDQARRFALVLASRGVEADERVAILLPNHPTFAVALLGTHWRGAVAAVLSTAWSVPDVVHALARADARLLVTTDALARAVGADPATTIVIDDEPGPSAFTAALAGASAAGAAQPAPRSADDAASILFSSGTTGDPKGVVLTHGNLRFNALAKRRYCGIRPSDRLALTVPMAHCFGQNVVLLGALLSGAAVRIYSRFDAATVSADIMDGHVTMLLCAPPAFTRLLALGNDAPLRALRYALTAAAPPADDLPRRWREVSGHTLAQGYGLTESSPFATYEPAVTGDARQVGRAIDGVEVRIALRDEPGGWAAGGQPGEIVIRGPNVMSGYWRQPEATAAALRDGWLRTGDVGTLDADGRLSLVDRVDDVINVAGFKAWPSDVERVLARHPLVAEVAAYAVPDAARGSAVAAAIVLQAGAQADAEEVAAFAASLLASFQRPASYRILDALPRSPSGKVLRRVLAAAHQGVAHASPANAERPATGLPAASR